MLRLRQTEAVLFSLVLLSLAPGASAISSLVGYDPSLGTLPGSQGWTFSALSPGPTPQMVGGSLHLGPTGDTEIWTNSSLSFDLNSASDDLQIEATIQVVSSDFALGFGGTTPRAGYEITAGDINGRGFTFFLSEDRIDLMNSGIGPSGASALFDTTDGFHDYRLATSNGTAKLFLDGSPTLLLTLAVGDSGLFSPNQMMFGDGTSAASSETYLSAITFSVIPEPSTALLLGFGLSALAATSRRRSLS